MRPALHALGIALALVLATTGCSGDETQPEADRSVSPSGPSTPSQAAGAQAVSAAECTVAGYEATDDEEVAGRRAVAVYAAGRALPPTGTWSGTDTLELFDLAPMRVTSPSGKVPGELRRAVLESVGGTWLPRGLPEQSGPHDFALRNDTRRNRMYVLYRGAELVTGTWSAQRCGAPYNDGTEVLQLSGRFSALTPVRRMHVYACGSEPADRFDRAASRVCRL